MPPMLRLLTILTGSVVFLTCSSIVELMKLVINTRLAKSGINNSWIIYVVTPILCTTVAFILITFTEGLNGV